MFLEIDPEKFQDALTKEGYNKFLCARILNARHEMLMASIPCHDKFRKDVEVEGFQVNPGGACATNEIRNGKQHALT